MLWRPVKLLPPGVQVQRMGSWTPNVLTSVMHATRWHAVYLAGPPIPPPPPPCVSDATNGAITLVCCTGTSCVCTACERGLGRGRHRHLPVACQLEKCAGWDLHWCMALHDHDLWAIPSSYVLRPPQSS